MPKEIEESFLKDINEPKNLNFLKRVFKKMKDGSWRLTIIMFICYTLGAGILSLPYTFSKLGLITGIIFLLLNYFMNQLSFNVFIKLKKKSKRNDMADILFYYLGPRYRRFLEIIIIFMFLNLEIVHLVIGWNFLRYILVNSFKNLEMEKKEYQYRIYYCLVSTLLLIPLMIKKKIVSLKYVTILFLICLFYCIIIFLIESPSYYDYFQKNDMYHFELFKKFEIHYFGYFSVFLFAFFSQPNMLNCWIEMKNPNVRRLKKTVNYGLFIELMIYLLFSVMGYIFFANNAQEIIILRNPIGTNKKDILMKIGIFTYLFGMVISNSFHGNVLTKLFHNIFKFKETILNRLLFGMIPIFFAMVLTVLYPNIITYLGICGGIFCNLTGYIIPFLIYYKNYMEKDSKIKKNLILALILFLNMLLVMNIVILFLKENNN